MQVELKCPVCGMNVTNAPSVTETKTQIVRKGWDDLSSDDDITQMLENLTGNQLHIYLLESHLGSGGMGHVYLAHHQDLHRKCALKILAPAIVETNDIYIESFRREGRTAAALDHPNVVTTHAIGVAEGYHFLEMEYIAGRTLRRLISDEGYLAPLRATAIAQRIAEGLACAHESEVLHRDLKPENGILTWKGVPKIADFGLAKFIPGINTDQNKQIVGTPHFMAPELFHRLPATPASDVYALGVCYYLMLTGHHPFAGESLAKLITSIQENKVPNIREALPHIPLEMTECLNLMLDKTPDNRPQNGMEAAALLHAISGEVRDIDSLLKEAFQNHPNVVWHQQHNRYELLLSLPDNRKQRVYIEASDHSVAERLLLIYSICCDANPQFYEQALRMNDIVLHGALSIKNIDGKAMFCMVDTYPRATVDAEEVRRSVLEVAAQADGVELLLTNRDIN